MRSPCTATKSSPRSPQLEKARVQQRRTNAANKKERKKILKKPSEESVRQRERRARKPVPSRNELMQRRGGLREPGRSEAARAGGQLPGLSAGPGRVTVLKAAGGHGSVLRGSRLVQCVLCTGHGHSTAEGAVGRGRPAGREVACPWGEGLGLTPESITRPRGQEGLLPTAGQRDTLSKEATGNLGLVVRGAQGGKQGSGSQRVPRPRASVSQQGRTFALRGAPSLFGLMVVDDYWGLPGPSPPPGWS